MSEQVCKISWRYVPPFSCYLQKNMRGGRKSAPRTVRGVIVDTVPDTFYPPPWRTFASDPTFGYKKLPPHVKIESAATGLSDGVWRWDRPAVEILVIYCVDSVLMV